MIENFRSTQQDTSNQIPESPTKSEDILWDPDKTRLPEILDILGEPEGPILARGNEIDAPESTQDGAREGHSETQEKDVAPTKIPCINERYEGQTHPETGVPFERKTIEHNGQVYEGVFPRFESACDAEIPKDKFEASDREHISICNEQLKKAVENDPELRAQFSEEQLEQIANGDTPDGFTWHHNEEPGKMQLVDTATHQSTGHTGGRSIWGGGREARA